jgi:hypothetical protein
MAFTSRMAGRLDCVSAQADPETRLTRRCCICGLADLWKRLRAIAPSWQQGKCTDLRKKYFVIYINVLPREIRNPPPKMWL